MVFSRRHLIGFVFIIILAVACAPAPAPAPATIPPETIPPTAHTHGAPADGFDLYADMAGLLSKAGLLLPGVEVAITETGAEPIVSFDAE